MRHFKVSRLDGTEPHFVATEDDQDAPPGYDAEEWQFEEVASPMDEATSIKTEIGDDTAKADEWASLRAELEADVAAGDVLRLRRQLAMKDIYQEVQLLKLANLVPNGIPTTAADRAKMFPNLMAHVQQTGNSLAAVATAVESRLEQPIRRMAVVEARLMRALEEIKNATTAEAKFAAIEAIDWSQV